MNTNFQGESYEEKPQIEDILKDANVIFLKDTGVIEKDKLKEVDLKTLQQYAEVLNTIKLKNEAS